MELAGFSKGSEMAAKRRKCLVGHSKELAGEELILADCNEQGALRWLARR